MLFLLALLFPFVESGGDEFELQTRLLDKYSALERPVNNVHDPVVVSLSLILRQLVDVHEINQVITLDTWVEHRWTDVNLRWDPNEFGGLNQTRFRTASVWRPDIFVYNSADNMQIDQSNPMVLVNSSGSVVWIPPVVLSVSCKMDFTLFPYDQQKCSVKFGSWTYSGLELDIYPKLETGIDLSDYHKSGEWELLDTPVERNTTQYHCCPNEPYPNLVFRLTIRRRTLYFIYILIVPSALVTVLTVFGFCLPPDSPVKVQLEITILLASIFFLRTVADVMPANSETIPILVIFFTACIAVISLSVIFSVLVINLSCRFHPIKGSIARRFFLQFLPSIMLLPKVPYAGKTEENETFLPSNSVEIEKDRNTELLERIYSLLMAMSQRLKHEDTSTRTRKEWRRAAQAVDRLCLLFFLLSLSIIFILIFSTLIYNENNSNDASKQEMPMYHHHKEIKSM